MNKELSYIDSEWYNRKMNENYDPEKPIIIGLAGKAATGKTSVAETIVPKASFTNERSGVLWDHIFFAMPLYEFYSIRTKIQGSNSQSRKLYAIHEALYDLYGASPLGKIPHYYELISLVDKIYNEPLPNTDTKPRSFLQKVGDYCRSYDEECFAKWGVRKAVKIYNEYVNAISEEEEIKPHCILISDVRFKNEAEAILAKPNSMVIEFTASDSIRRERIFGRDSVYMTDEQMSHRSELEIDTFKDLITESIDSSELTIEEQSMKTIDIIKKRFGI